VKTPNDYIEEIKAVYDEATIAGSLDETILDYVDPNWEEDGFDDEFDCYWGRGGGEAESDVINDLLEEFEVPEGHHDEVVDLILAAYPCLRY
jgi:hypothetical protein